MTHSAPSDAGVDVDVDHPGLAACGRVCVVCGASLAKHRSDATHCGGPCRAEAARLRAILNSKPGQTYQSLAERFKASQRRTGTAWGMLRGGTVAEERRAPLASPDNRSQRGISR